MGLKDVVQGIAVLAILALATGRLPQILNTVRKAQIELVQDSKASKWRRGLLLPERN